MTDLEQLKYPIGKTTIPKNITAENMENWISVIENFSSKLNNLVFNLIKEQLDTVYRKNGGTNRQLIH